VLHDVLTQLRVSDPVLVGWSLGGMVTLQYVLDHPEQVSAMILVDTSPIGRVIPSLGVLPRIPPHWIPNLQHVVPLIRLLSYLIEWLLRFSNTLPIRRGVAALLVHLLAAGKTPDRPLIAWATQVLLDHLNIRALNQLSIGLLTFNVITRLPEIAIPTLIIHGREDRIFSLHYPELLRQHIRNSKYQVIERTGHSPHLETPDAFNDVVVQFLTTLPRTHDTLDP
jgi:pimeloyl-[acyl-carrier protein] methyl ester esterase